MSEKRSSSGIAEGTLYPARFLKLGAAEGGLLQAGATDKPIGVSFCETRRIDYVDSNNYLALVGEPASYYTEASDCMIELGGTVTIGNYLKPSTNGVAIAVTTDADYYGAVAKRSGVTGDIIPCTVLIGQQAS